MCNVTLQSGHFERYRKGIVTNNIGHNKLNNISRIIVEDHKNEPFISRRYFKSTSRYIIDDTIQPESQIRYRIMNRLTLVMSPSHNFNPL